ncbi:hypothetical protein OROMI_029223 [Orobanche minor]
MCTRNVETELRSIYSQLCQDDMPMVRRSAATNLGKFAATIEPAHLKTDIMSIFEDLTQDDQDSVRLLAVEGCAALGKLLEPQDCVAHILPVIVNFSQVFEKPTDKSWRVRYMVANQLYELCEAVGPEPTSGLLLLPKISHGVGCWKWLRMDNKQGAKALLRIKDNTRFAGVVSPGLECSRDLLFIIGQ